nr:uncharacterized protein LOC129280419 [Lytechinus pictus]
MFKTKIGTSFVSTRNSGIQLPERLCLHKSDITWGTEIGEGSCARVYKGALNSGVQVALKRFKYGKGIPKYEEVLKREVQTLMKLTHANIVQCLGMCIPEMTIVLELCNKEIELNGKTIHFQTLRQMVDILEDTLPEDLKLEALTQTALGMEYLHEREVIHCDLKSQNVLVYDGKHENSWVFKISDVGEAHINIRTTYTSTISTNRRTPVGTIPYQAPELFTTVPVTYTNANDIYSYGMLMYELCNPNEQFPWETECGSDTNSIRNRVMKGERPSLNNCTHTPDAIIELMRKCWAQEATQRPTFQEIGKFFLNFKSDLQHGTDAVQQSIEKDSLKESPIRSQTARQSPIPRCLGFVEEPSSNRPSTFGDGYDDATSCHRTPVNGCGMSIEEEPSPILLSSPKDCTMSLEKLTPIHPRTPSDCNLTNGETWGHWTSTYKDCTMSCNEMSFSAVSQMSTNQGSRLPMDERLHTFTSTSTGCSKSTEVDVCSLLPNSDRCIMSMAEAPPIWSSPSNISQMAIGEQSLTQLSNRGGYTSPLNGCSTFQPSACKVKGTSPSTHTLFRTSFSHPSNPKDCTMSYGQLSSSDPSTPQSNMSIDDPFSFHDSAHKSLQKSLGELPPSESFAQTERQTSFARSSIPKRSTSEECQTSHGKPISPQPFTSSVQQISSEECTVSYRQLSSPDPSTPQSNMSIDDPFSFHDSSHKSLQKSLGVMPSSEPSALTERHTSFAEPSVPKPSTREECQTSHSKSSSPQPSTSRVQQISSEETPASQWANSEGCPMRQDADNDSYEISQPITPEPVTEETIMTWSGYASKFFKINCLHNFQIQAIGAFKDKRDCLVVSATSSGKSLCFQLPAAMGKANEMVLVIIPTIAIGKDQVEFLRTHGVYAQLLGTAAEKTAYDDFINKEKGKPKILFLSPESLLGDDHFRGLICRLKEMHTSGELKISLIAIDEAHLICEWGGSFRVAYNKVRNLKHDFPEVPLMALTATLPKSEEVNLAEDILRTPIILRSSASRTNICIKLQRYLPTKGKDASWRELAICIKEQVKEEKTIVYCSFTGECDDLCLALCDCGVEAAAYTGHNRTAAEKEQIHKNMNDGVIQVLVATQAFGLGVNIPWIRWVIHIGCPPNIPVWVQAAGRAGRDGMPANAVIYFAEHHDLQRVKFWTKNVAVGEKIKKKAQFKDVLLYLYTAMAGKCLQERQLAVFGEQHQSDDTRGTCDGCEIKRNVCSVDVRKEIVQIQEALTELKTLGLSCVSETKLCEWLNGKEMPWMGKYAPTDNQPEAASFVSLTKKPDVLGIILRQAAALDLVSLVILESRKDGRVDLINKYWSVTEENQQKLEEVAELILPTAEDINTWYEHKRKVDCEGSFVYVYPTDNNDRQRWLGFLAPNKDGHFACPVSNKPGAKLEEMVADVVKKDPTKKPSDIIKGYGLACLPAADALQGSKSESCIWIEEEIPGKSSQHLSLLNVIKI